MIRHWIIPLDKRWQPRFYYLIYYLFLEFAGNSSLQKMFCSERGSSVDSFEKLSLHRLQREPSTWCYLWFLFCFQVMNRQNRTQVCGLCYEKHTRTFSFLQMCVGKNTRHPSEPLKGLDDNFLKRHPHVWDIWYFLFCLFLYHKSEHLWLVKEP